MAHFFAGHPYWLNVFHVLYMYWVELGMVSVTTLSSLYVSHWNRLIRLGVYSHTYVVARGTCRISFSAFEREESNPLIHSNHATIFFHFLYYHFNLKRYVFISHVILQGGEGRCPRQPQATDLC